MAQSAANDLQNIDDFLSGDLKAMDRLFECVYSELKTIARSRLNQERPNHTLRPTELVHKSRKYLQQLSRSKSLHLVNA